MPDQSCDNVLAEPEEELTWSNSDNNAFYENLKVEGLKAFAEKAGLASGCDMDVLTPYWSKVESILEVGAGYGRVIDYLLKHEFKGKITAVEQCGVLSEHLNKQFSQYENVHLLQADIRGLSETENHFNIILLLWGSICNFPPKEQSIVLKKLSKLLKDKGKLIIDAPPISSLPSESRKNNEQFYSIEKNLSTMHFHLPSISEIKSYTQKAKFSDLSQTTYQTNRSHRRYLYISS